MKITVKSTKILKEGKKKDGTPYKFVGVQTEEGPEYTTFHGGVVNLLPGTIIKIDKVKLDTDKEGREKRSFGEYEIVSAPAGGISATTNGKPQMTPADWAEKDRLERWSRECNACFMGLPALIGAKPLEKSQSSSPLLPSEALALEVWTESMNYAMAHFKENPSSIPKPPPKASTEPKKPIESGTPPFNNPGEFYTACLKTYGLSKSIVDAEIVGIDLTDVEQREKAWGAIVTVHGEKDPNDPEELFK